MAGTLLKNCIGRAWVEILTAKSPSIHLKIHIYLSAVDFHQLTRLFYVTITKENIPNVTVLDYTGIVLRQTSYICSTLISHCGARFSKEAFSFDIIPHDCVNNRRLIPH